MESIALTCLLIVKHPLLDSALVFLANSTDLLQLPVSQYSVSFFDQIMISLKRWVLQIISLIAAAFTCHYLPVDWWWVLVTRSCVGTAWRVCVWLWELSELAAQSSCREGALHGSAAEGPLWRLCPPRAKNQGWLRGMFWYFYIHNGSVWKRLMSYTCLTHTWLFPNVPKGF